MIQITCKANRAQCSRTERLTSGMAGLQCEFVFDDAWNGLAKTAVFVAGNEQRDVLLTGDTCTVPWEVLRLPDYQLTVGVYGINADGTLALPTVYANCGGIVAGADPSGNESEEPTPTLVEQIMAAAGTAVATANAVKFAADAGEFKGEQGPKGDKGDPGQTPDLNDYQRTLITNGAAAGQIAQIASVDEYGKPTAWEAVNMPQSGGDENWEVICDITTTEPVASIGYLLQHDYKKLRLIDVGSATVTSNKMIYAFSGVPSTSFSWLMQNAYSLINTMNGNSNAYLSSANKYTKDVFDIEVTDAVMHDTISYYATVLGTKVSYNSNELTQFGAKTRLLMDRNAPQYNAGKANTYIGISMCDTTSTFDTGFRFIALGVRK